MACVLMTQAGVPAGAEPSTTSATRPMAVSVQLPPDELKGLASQKSHIIGTA